MKRFYVLIGVLAAAMIGYIATQLSAQPVAQEAPPQTRVAFVNIVSVFQKYDKAKNLKLNMEKQLEPYKLEAKKLNEEAEEWIEWTKKNPNASEEDREKAKRAVLVRKRRLEDINSEVSKLVGKQNEEQVITLYKEVTEEVKRYATAHGFQTVLAYGDAEPTDPELFSFANISRKVQGMEMGGGVSLMYVDPRVEISMAVVNSLNRNVAPRGGDVVPGAKSGD